MLRSLVWNDRHTLAEPHKGIGVSTLASVETASEPFPRDKRGGERGTREVRRRPSLLENKLVDELVLLRLHFAQSFVLDAISETHTAQVSPDDPRSSSNAVRPDVARKQCLPLVLQLFFSNKSLKLLLLSLPLLRHRLQQVPGSDCLDGNKRKL